MGHQSTMKLEPVAPGQTTPQGKSNLSPVMTEEVDTDSYFSAVPMSNINPAYATSLFRPLHMMMRGIGYCLLWRI